MPYPEYMDLTVREIVEGFSPSGKLPRKLARDVLDVKMRDLSPDDRQTVGEIEKEAFYADQRRSAAID